MNGWKPIITFPKDGTWILCYQQIDNKTYKIQSARWHDGVLGGPGWEYSVKYYPTHWRPMIDLPEIN